MMILYVNVVNYDTICKWDTASQLYPDMAASGEINQLSEDASIWIICLDEYISIAVKGYRTLSLQVHTCRVYRSTPVESTGPHLSTPESTGPHL